MAEFYHAAKISDSVYWVGAIDWSIRDFHGYSTHRGTTYNAYLIMADKITLIDTVKKQFKEEMMARIATVIDPSKIDYIVSNHAELDHSGSLPEVIREINPEKVFASTQGKKVLNAHFPDELELDVVKTGETLDLGNLTLSFIETRMLHWPDSMFTILVEEGVLFSQDAFGMHLATSERFADECKSDIVHYETAKYYANILLPYSKLVKNLLVNLEKMNLDIRILAHDHGPIFRSNISEPIEWYRQWAEQKPVDRALIIYDTMWGSTARMANAIGDGLISSGVKVKQMPIGGSHRADIATELLECGALIVGSPTLNSNLFPTVADALVYIKGLRPQNLVSALFGSYGWGGEAFRQIREYLDAMKLEVVGEVRCQYVPGNDALADCFSLGKQVAEKVKGALQ